MSNTLLCWFWYRFYIIGIGFAIPRLFITAQMFSSSGQTVSQPAFHPDRSQLRSFGNTSIVPTDLGAKDQWPFQGPKLEILIPHIHKAYVRPKVQRISPRNMAKHILQYLHFRVLKFPLKGSTFRVSQGILYRWQPSSWTSKAERIAIFTCRILIYVFSMGQLFVNQVRCNFDDAGGHVVGGFPWPRKLLNQQVLHKVIRMIEWNHTESPYQHLFCVDTEVWWRCLLVNDQSDAKFVPGDSQLYTWGCRNIGCGVPLRHTIWNQWKLIVSFSLKRTSYMTSKFHGLSTFSRPKFHGLS